MISKLVHKHIPINQLNHVCFEKYKSENNNINKLENINTVTMNIDDLLK